ncbi:sequence-specific DNA binding sequence-specific DNA binding transcription factors [Euphorbia peplus]|nr:sequence-specific DNA binding sequence-specific DNA binding transcription factors [Euphorbia peplus]
MRLAKDESSYNAEQVIDLISAVKELHVLSSQDLNKLIRDSENFTIHFRTEKGSSIKIDVEKLAGFLPLHLIAVLVSSDKDEALLRYLLCGIRLLHSLCELAPRHAKLEQILLDDVKVSEQLIDLVFYVLIVLNGVREEVDNKCAMPLLHSALVACSLYLLIGCISSHWQDLIHVLLAHPKVDIFMDAAFGAVHLAIRFLQIKLSAQQADIHMRSSLTAEQIASYVCQQCEVSLQFLQSLCQQKLFRERLLRNKELCGNGGVLFLAQAILKLNIAPPFMKSSIILASVSRLKSKVLSILLNLCEAESISYLDEVASSPGSFDLAKAVALEVLQILKTALCKDPKHLTASSQRSFPTGLMRLNAMRLADIFSDDSNFRSFITTSFTRFLTAIFLLPHGEFLSIWCSSELPLREEDATLEYDIFTEAGLVLETFSLFNSSAMNLETTLIPSNMPQASYAHQRTSLFVKVIANLHCFVPNICEEQERNLFLNKFLECMWMDPSESLPGFCFTPGSRKGETICNNLRSLLCHAESLIPNFLNEEDVQLLRVFFNQLEPLVNSANFEENPVQETKQERSVSFEEFAKLAINEHHQEAQSTGLYSSPLLNKEASNVNNPSSNPKEEMSENSGFQEEEPNLRSEHINHSGDAEREEKDKSVGIASAVVKEVDRDLPNVETSGSDTSSTRGKNFVGQMGSSDFPKSSETKKENGLQGVQEERFETLQIEEKQPRKRKRTIMNDYQIALIEKALVDVPDMQRNSASIQSWADKLSLHGSEVTFAQLKNWLNNRKARLARAGKEVRVENAVSEKQGIPALRHSQNSPESHDEENLASGARLAQIRARISSGGNAETSVAEGVGIASAEHVQCKQGEEVMLVDKQGEAIGEGKIYQVQGQWFGMSLEESGTCVVDITDLRAERWVRLPHPSEATGTSFLEAEIKHGVMRVLWDSNKIMRVFRPR